MRTKNDKGLSLIELLISMTLGLIVIGACIQIYLLAKQLSIKGNGLIRIQENARVINTQLGKSLETSGKMGCNAFSDNITVSLTPDIDANNLMLLPLSGVMGVNPQTLRANPFLSAQMLVRIKLDSDILAVKSVHSLKPLHYIDLKANLIIVKGNFEIEKGQLIVLSDCAQALIAYVKGLEHNKGYTKLSISPTKEPLNYNFSKSAMVGILSSVLYYIADTGRKNANNKAIVSLYKTDLNGRTIELVEGVEEMKIQYGLSNKPFTFLCHHNIQNWSAISKVRCIMRLNSVEDSITLNTNIKHDDSLMRMWWTFEWLIKKNHAAQS